MKKTELIEICKSKSKDCINKYDFKKKHGYWYKLCCREKIIDIVFDNYNSTYQHYVNQSKKYSLEFLLNFCRSVSKTELITYNKAYYMLLKEFYKIDIKSIEFRKKKRPEQKFTNEYLINITRDIKYKIDFLNNYPDEYKYCKNKHIFNTICPHLIPFNISRPQMILNYLTNKIFGLTSSVNNRKVIYPYEIDIFYDTLNLGFEYNGYRWHVDNKNDDIKKIKTLEKGIRIIYIYENNRNYEIDIKNQLIEHIDELNNFLNTKIDKEFILNIEIDYDKIISYNLSHYTEIASKYQNKSQFQKLNNKEYLNCVKLNIIEIIAPHFKRRKIWNIEEALNEAKKYSKISDLINNNNNCYQFLLKNDLIKEINLEKRFLYKNVDELYIRENFQSIRDIIEKNYSLYKYLRKNNQEIIKFLKYYSEDYIYFILNKSKTFSSFKRSGEIYKLSYLNGEHRALINNFFKKIDFNKYFDLEIDHPEIKNTCSLFNDIKSFKKKYPKIYKYLLKNSLIDEFFNHIETLKFRNNRKRMT